MKAFEDDEKGAGSQVLAIARIIPTYLPKRQQKNKSKRLFIILVIWVELP